MLSIIIRRAHNTAKIILTVKDISCSSGQPSATCVTHWCIIHMCELPLIMRNSGNAMMKPLFASIPKAQAYLGAHLTVLPFSAIRRQLCGTGGFPEGFKFLIWKTEKEEGVNLRRRVLETQKIPEVQKTGDPKAKPKPHDGHNVTGTTVLCL